MAMNIDDVLARLDPYRKQMRPDWEMTLAPADYDVIRNHVLTCKDYDVIHSRIAALESALATANARADNLRRRIEYAIGQHSDSVPWWESHFRQALRNDDVDIAKASP